MRPNWSKLASLAQKTCTLDSFQFLGEILASKGFPFDIKHIELHYSWLLGLCGHRKKPPALHHSIIFFEEP